jgi:hypothetical protein
MGLLGGINSFLFYISNYESLELSMRNVAWIYVINILIYSEENIHIYKKYKHSDGENL